MRNGNDGDRLINILVCLESKLETVGTGKNVALSERAGARIH